MDGFYPADDSDHNGAGDLTGPISLDGIPPEAIELMQRIEQRSIAAWYGVCQTPQPRTWERFTPDPRFFCPN